MQRQLQILKIQLQQQVQEQLSVHDNNSLSVSSVHAQVKQETDKSMCRVQALVEEQVQDQTRKAQRQSRELLEEQGESYNTNRKSYIREILYSPYDCRYCIILYCIILYFMDLICFIIL